jgi:hypothetical protein
MIAKAIIKYQTLFHNYISNSIAIAEEKAGRELVQYIALMRLNSPSPVFGWLSKLSIEI